MMTISVSAWNQLQPEQAPSAVFVPALRAFIGSGEHVQLTNPVVYGTMQFKYCKVLKALPDSLQLQVQLLQIGTHLEPLALDQINPPPGRAYLEYPRELVLSNLVCNITISTVESEIFVFSVRAIESSQLGIAAGMSNAFCVRYKWEATSNSLSSVGDLLLSFPIGRDSFSKRVWSLVCRCHDAMAIALNRGALNQNNSSTQILPCTEEEWLYLKRRLSGVEV
jgi:hypothetical protein